MKSGWVLALALLSACSGEADSGDSESDSEPAARVQAPFGEPVSVLADGLSSCAVYGSTRCEDGVASSCEIVDGATGEPVASPHPLLERVYLWERYHDLYTEVDGVTAERSFSRPILAGEAESAWGSPDVFREFDGFGDGAIWTGVAVHGAMHRWLQTGTDADYARFEGKLRALLDLFEVTGADGYLARSVFYRVPDGTPNRPEHLLLEEQDDSTIRFPAPEPSRTPRLARDTLEDGTPAVLSWQGNPSIDQYTGAMVAFPSAFGLVRDSGLQERMATHMSCYLKRLEHIQLVGLSENPELLDAAVAALGGQVGDLDLESLDSLSLFALPALNDATWDDYAWACPSELPSEPDQVIDATDPGFVGQVALLGLRLQKGATNGIDHVYIPGVRAGDAAHMAHLSAMSFYMTGDEAYWNFLQDEVLAEHAAAAALSTVAAYVPPSPCRSFYGDHITLPPMWALRNLLGPSELRDQVEDALFHGGYLDLTQDLNNAKFMLLAADTVFGESALQADAMGLLEAFGGFDVLADPRRAKRWPHAELLDVLGEAALRCPTEAERGQCEAGVEALGIEFEGDDISFPCSGSPLECPMEDGQCTWAHAVEPLPMSLRPYTDFVWQRDPFELPIGGRADGTQQSPGLDLTESFWLARSTGATNIGADTALAWVSGGSCEAE